MKITYRWEVEYQGMLGEAIHDGKLIKWKLYDEEMPIEAMRKDFEKISNERFEYLTSKGKSIN